MYKLSFYFLLVIAIMLNPCICRSQNALNTAILDSLFNNYLHHNKMMGSVAICKKGRIVYSKAKGFAAMEGSKKTDATTGTKYRIGSISKMFTATMIIQLIDEKKLNLDTKLGMYYPEIPNADKITIRMMLNHHSGIHNFTDSSYLTYYTQRRTHKEILDILSKQKPEFLPDEKAEYSNTNFVLLGYILERITKHEYSKELKKRITDKIALKNTFYGGKIDIIKNEAASYEFKKAWAIQPETDMSIPGGAGSIVSTSEDLDQFITALFACKLISPAWLDTMKTLKDNFGLGIFKFPFYDQFVYGHGGAIDGFNTTLIYSPADSVAFAICSNGIHNLDLNNALIGVMSIYYDKKYKIPVFTDYTLPVEEMPKYEGTYSSTQLPLKITIKKNDKDELTAQATGQEAFPLDAVTNKEFRFDKAGVIITFSITKEGKINAFVLKQGGQFYSFTKE